MIEFWSYLVIIFGYIAPPIFIGGIIWRIWNYKRYPTGFDWAVQPQPTQNSFINLMWRAFAWPTLFKGDKPLWIGAMLFHISIAILFVGHLGLFVDMIAFSGKLGISKDATYIIGIIAGSIALVALLFFIARRIWVTKAKVVSTFADYFWLLFLLTVVVIGLYARLADEATSETVREFSRNLWTFQPEMPPAHTWFLIHTFLAEIFIIYAVVGKPIHLVGQLFTQYIMTSERR